MELESVLPLVMVTIDRLANDSNWVVKQTVAEALITVHTMDPETYRSQLIEGALTRLLKDRSPLVIGAALMSWEAICPERWDLLHKRFRPFCWFLPDADENGQHVIMRVLTRFVRVHFINPDPLTNSNKIAIDPDLTLFLDSVSPLFKSRNASVVIAATNVFIFLAPQLRLHEIVPDLIRLVEEKSAQSEDETLFVILHHIYQIIKFTTSRYSKKIDQEQKPHLFSDSLNHFLISSTDSQPVNMIKLKILSSFISVNSDRSMQLKILSELKFYSKDLHLTFAKEVIRTIGEMIVTTTGKVQLEALNALNVLVKSGQNNQVCESIEIMRALLSSDRKTVNALLPNLQKTLNEDLIQLLVQNKIQEDRTRANLYRLISEIDNRSQKRNSNFTQFYKYSISNFIQEGAQAKFQILSLVSKSLSLVFIRREEQDQDHQSMMNAVLFDERRIYYLGFEHLMRLARYDTDVFIRDRARYLQGLFMSTPAFNLFEEKNSTDLVERNNGQHEGTELLNEDTTFTRRNHVLSSSLDPSNPILIQDLSPNKTISLKELQRVLFLDSLAESVNFKNAHSKTEFEASSLFRVLGLNHHDKVMKNSTAWNFLDWNMMPPWSSFASDPRLRDPDNELEPPTASLSSAVHLTSENLHKSPSNENYPGSSYQHFKKKDKVTLIPTDEDEYENKSNKPTYRNLEDFLQSSDDEDKEDEDTGDSSDGSDDEDESEEEVDYS